MRPALPLVAALLLAAACDDTPAASDDARAPDDTLTPDVVSPDVTPPDAPSPDVTPPDVIALPDAPAAPCNETVATVAELVAAVGRLGPGRVLCLAPGRYVLASGTRLRFGPERSGTAAAPAVLRARDGLGTVTLVGNRSEEVLWFPGGSYIEVRGLVVTGGDYHAIKIDGPSRGVRVVGNELVDNLRIGASGFTSQVSAIKGFQVIDAVIEGNEIHEAAPWGGSNLQGVDCNACNGWVVRDNRIHDLRAASPSGTCVQFKSGSRDTLIEGNRIWGCSSTGINVGGFGNPMAWAMPPTDCEHVGGVVRNNLVWRVGDAGISLLAACGARVYHNTLWGNGYTPDVRRFAREVRYQNNLLDQAIRFRDGTMAGVTASNNVALPTPGDMSWFADPAAGDLHLRATATAAIDRGLDLGAAVPTDFEGDARPRGAGSDLGADER